MLSLVKRSVSNGVKEIYSNGECGLTEGERVVVVVGATWCIGGVLSSVVATTVVAKVMTVTGAVVAVGALGKSFVRGFSEQWSLMKRLEK